MENDSTSAAYRTQVDFQVVDRRHRSVVDQTSPKPQAMIRTILPGQRVGVASKALLRHGPGFFSQQVAEADGFDVHMATVQWWPLGTGPTLRPITAQYRQTKRVSAAGDFFYSVDSPLCGTVARDGMSIIFRNHAGAVAGGLYVEGTSHQSCAPGRHDEDVLVGGVPSDVDDQKTEAYPYCDLIVASSTPRTPN